MNPVPKAALALDQSLRHDIGAPDVRYMAMIEAPSEDEALQASEAAAARLTPLVAASVLGGFDAPHLYLPSLKTQQARRDALPYAPALAEALGAAVTGLPFKPDLFAPFLADVDAAKTGPGLARASLAGTTLALKLDSMLLKRGDRWVVILPLQDVRDPAQIAAALQGSGTLLDMKGESAQLLSGYLAEAQTLALFGSLAIMILLALSLRATRRVLIVLAPLAAAVILTTALLTLGGAKLSIFNLFGLLLVVAVGSNYALFFERAEREPAEAGRMIASLVLANLCTVIAFGVLSFSAIPILHGIGRTVAIGTMLTLLIGAILMRKRA
jgi:predicted exporter